MKKAVEIMHMRPIEGHGVAVVLRCVIWLTIEFYNYLFLMAPRALSTIGHERKKRSFVRAGGRR